MNSHFKPPFWQFNGHFQSIYPSFFRKLNIAPYTRERLELSDGDFVDLDWIQKGSKKLLIVTHGLEGDSYRPYVLGILKKFTENGYDGLGWNCRSCSGELNRLPRFYHHGDAGDLKQVVSHALEKYGYEEVVLAGFSMGGSLTLRFLAEYAEEVPKEVQSATVASVPLDLVSAVAELNKKGKQFYMKNFIRKLKWKIEAKSKLFPDHMNWRFEAYEKEVKNFDDFDSRYTAPLHGYKDATDFYAKASVKPLLKNIRVPALIIQAANDPFLSPPCLDLGVAQNNENLELLVTKTGGHVGFMQKNSDFTFVEEQAWTFSENLKGGG